MGVIRSLGRKGPLTGPQALGFEFMGVQHIWGVESKNNGPKGRKGPLAYMKMERSFNSVHSNTFKLKHLTSSPKKHLPLSHLKSPPMGA